MEKESFILKNAMETVVEQRVDTMLNKSQCCKCDKCRMDIMAYALNHLPPKYVATHRGELFTKVDALNFQHAADVTSAIANAIEAVRSHPHH